MITYIILGGSIFIVLVILEFIISMRHIKKVFKFKLYVLNLTKTYNEEKFKLFYTTNDVKLAERFDPFYFYKKIPSYNTLLKYKYYFKTFTLDMFFTKDEIKELFYKYKEINKMNTTCPSKNNENELVDLQEKLPLECYDKDRNYD